MANDKTDRRTARTRAALLDAFGHLVHERHNLDEIRIGDIVARANVGRSTFYEHFKSKDEILTKSFETMFEALAGVVDEKHSGRSIMNLLDHLWFERDIARSLFGGSRRVLTRVLAGAMEDQLRRFKSATAGNRIAVRVAAVALAEAQIGAIRAWISGELFCASRELAHTLTHLARACTAPQRS